MFHKRAVFINLVIFIGKHLCWSVFFNEDGSLQSCDFIEKRLQHRCFPVNIVKFLRTPVLKNICERLFKHFPSWINNITSNIRSGHFLKKNKKKSKTQLDEKTCLFMMLLIISLFSISPMHVRRGLPYIIKDDNSSEGLQNRLTNEGLFLKNYVSYSRMFI